MRYHLIPVRMAHIKKSANSNCWRGCGEKGTLLHCWWKCKLIQPLWRTVWRFLKKLRIKLLYDSAVPLLSKYPEEARTEKYLNNVHCSTIYNSRTWKWPRCQLADEWIKKLWNTYKMECYTAIYSYTFESVIMRWTNLEPIIQSEVSEKVKEKYSILMNKYWRKKWQPTSEFLLVNPHGQRSLEGYSPWCCKESDTTEMT